MKKPTREEAQKLADEAMKKAVFSDPLLPLPAKKSTKKKKPAAKGKDDKTPEGKPVVKIGTGNDIEHKDDYEDDELPDWDPLRIAAFLKEHLSEMSEEGKRIALEQIEYFESSSRASNERDGQSCFTDQPSQRVDMTPEEKLLEEICAGNDEPMTEGERAFLLEILRGEIYDVADRFTGCAITSTLITPEQQKFIDEWNAEHGGEAKQT